MMVREFIINKVVFHKGRGGEKNWRPRKRDVHYDPGSS